MATNSSSKDQFPYATMALLLACAAATLAFDRSSRAELFVCYPREPFRFYGGPLLLSLFTHEGFPHLALNSAILAPLGYAAERRLGPLAFLALFFLSGLAGIAGQAAATDVGTIGASGAISGLVVAELFARGPEAEGGFAEILAVGWLSIDLLGLHAQIHGTGGLIGHAAHLAGAAAGCALGLGLATRPGRGSSLRGEKAKLLP